jgi:proline iminopeptidase
MIRRFYSCLITHASCLVASCLVASCLFFAFSLSAETFRSHDGTVLHYDVVGKGRPVLLLSGGPGFSPDYLRPVANELSGKYRFILLHQRGTGRSTEPGQITFPNLVADIESLRRELGQEQLILAGHSFGGILSMMYARTHPDRVAALALINSGGPTLKAVAQFNANLESRFSAEEKAAIKEWTGRLEKERRKAVFEITKAKTAAYFADRSKAKLLIDGMNEDSFRDSVFWAIVPQMMALDIREGLDKVKAPVLVLHGKQDPLETAAEVHETFPGSKLVVLENAGHFAWLEQPKAFFGALGDFLRTVVER